MQSLTIVQSSLNPNSKTSAVCRVFEQKCKDVGLDTTYIDLRDIEMEFCDGRDLKAYSKDLQKAYIQIEKNEISIFGMPVYQYSMSGVLKNFIDICGGALKGKPIGCIVNAGGPNCYMASQDLFNALQFEYATTSIMPTPYTWAKDFDEQGDIVNPKVLERLDELIAKIISL